MFDPDLVPAQVEVDDSMLRVRFRSGLEVATPVSRFPRLQKASPQERSAWRLIGKGDGIHWPGIDEDVSVKGLFAGVRQHPESAVEKIPQLIGDLYRATVGLNKLFPGRPFTPDGHLVGSIGEVVAEYIYSLVLQPCSTPSVDAHTRDGKSVQIKLTGHKGSSYAMRWSNKTENRPPDLLICLKLGASGFSEIYNGAFPTELLIGRNDQKNGQIALSVKRLQQLNQHLLPHANSFASINRWFSPSLSEVA